MSDQFKSQTLEQATVTLGHHEPTGRAWAYSKTGSVMGDLFASTAVPLKITTEYIELLSVEFDINQTFDLLPDWEESVSIPDGCVFSTETIATRRLQVIDRLTHVPVITIADVQSFIDFYFPGATITIKTGSEYYSFEYDFEVPFFGDSNEKWVIVAEILESDSVDQDRLRCILETAIPAPAVLLIEELNDV